MNVVIRELKPEDKVEWLRMRRALWPDCGEERHVLEVELLQRPSQGVVLVAVQPDGTPCGFAEISIRRDHVEGTAATPVPYLEGWYVDATCRGAGIGQKLIASAETWASTQGYTELASDAELENQAGIAAHKECGFVEKGRTVHFVKSISRAR